MDKKRAQAQLKQFGVALSNEKSQKGWMTKPMHEGAEVHYFSKLSSALAYWNRIAISHLEHRHVIDQMFDYIFSSGTDDEKEQFFRWCEQGDMLPDVIFRVPMAPFKRQQTWRKDAIAIFTPDKPIDRSWADYYAREKLVALLSKS